MRAKVLWATLIPVMASTGCEALPPLEYESEHALVGTHMVDQVCAGSLARIDWAIEYVDETLGRATGGEPARVYVVSRTDIADHCEGHFGGCVSSGDVFITTGSFDDVLIHELVHERIRRTVGRWSKPLFNEGIACAIGEAHAPPLEGAPRSPFEAYLAVSSGRELIKLHHGYYHAGELTHWLIDTYGVSAVLEFMGVLSRRDSADEVRATYAGHFGRGIDEDLFVHARDESEMTRANVNCTGLEIALEPERPRFRLEADLSCNSPRVENEWVLRDRVFVEWVIQIDEETRGPWAPVRLPGDDAIPRGTLLEIVPCRRPPHWRSRWTPSSNPVLVLELGLHRVRWYGPMDGHQTLDLELGGPCDELAQDCEAGERCVAGGVCIPAPP